jgi:hypothetical protein
MPNPAIDQITIQFENNSSNNCISIQNLRGQVLFEKCAARARFHIDISNIPSGAYFVLWRNSESIEVGKFIKQ